MNDLPSAEPESLDLVAQRFKSVVQEYCDSVASATRLEKHEFLICLFPSLAKLISAAAALPQVELLAEHPLAGDVSADEERDVRAAISEKLGKADWYWENFEPTEEKEVGLGSLAGDLAETYADVKGILLALEGGASPQDAIWEWRFDFETHWGKHAIDALRVIYHLALT